MRQCLVFLRKKRRIWDSAARMRRHKTDPLRNEKLFKFCTGWYYFQSRYYDPTTCRFISADVLLSTGQGVIGHNSYECFSFHIVFLH